MKYNLFIGRWDPFHKGHKVIVDSFVKNNRPVCIAIRDSPGMFSVEERWGIIREIYPDKETVKIIVIPDIEQVCIGRDVGYAVVEVPDKIKKISATKIREDIKNGK